MALWQGRSRKWESQDRAGSIPAIYQSRSQSMPVRRLGSGIML